MTSDEPVKIPHALKDSIGYSFMRASHGDPWECIRYTGTLITDLTIVVTITGNTELKSKCAACSQMWEVAVREFESSRDDLGNPNWGHPVLICTRILKMLGEYATTKYGNIPTDAGEFIGSGAKK